MHSKDAKFARMQDARRSETGMYVLVHQDFTTPKQRSSRLEIRIRP